MLRDLFGLFPAYAGVIPLSVLPSGPLASFPRIRGGDPDRRKVYHRRYQLFPAYAGVIPVANAVGAMGNAFPRIRGGDPKTEVAGTDKKTFSPHTRG